MAIDKKELESVMQKVVATGDLAKLSEREKYVYYSAKCEAAGLDPAATPFSYITLQGKMTLYATKTCTDMLIGAHKLNVSIVDRQHLGDLGIYEVHCRVTFPDGRQVEDFAAVSIQGAKGDGLANAIMKGVTKAKRRTVLSACGLGMLDETETETIPGAVIHGAPNPAPAPERPKPGNAMDLPPVKATNPATGEIRMVAQNQHIEIAGLWKAKFASEDEARGYMQALLNKTSRKDLTFEEAGFLISEMVKLPNHEPYPVEVPANNPDELDTAPADPDQLKSILHHMKRAFGDVIGSVIAREQAQAHMRAITGKTASKDLSAIEAATYLQAVTQLPDAGSKQDPIPF